MLKRNIAILIAGGLLGAQANLAGAIEGDSNVEILPAQLKYFEERAARIQAESQGDAYKTVVNISASTKYVNAERDGVLVIKNDKGQSFTWRADPRGEAVIPLKAIAPAGFVGGETTIYVRHPLGHISGGD